MITGLDVENYKCLQKTSVDLGTFTVLIGANDSGKSSILDAIQLAGRTVNEDLRVALTPHEGETNGDPFDALVWRRDIQRRIGLDIRGTAGSRTFTYSLKLRTGPAVDAEVLEIDGGR